jgi:hypothetical protein
MGTMGGICSASEEAIALSQRNRELVRRNIHKVHFGPDGYQRQLKKWRRERDATIAAGQPNPFEGLTNVPRCGFKQVSLR